MSDEILDEALNASFISPDREFKGEKLAPYTEGSKLLLFQTRQEEDSPIFFVWSFVYMHILINKDRKEAIKLAWNKEKFRESVFEWIATKNEDDRIIASNLVEGIIEDATRGKVDVVPEKFLSPPGN